MGERKKVLSCIQPTGEMHIGNYFGAVQNWVRLQDEYQCYYGVVDYHSITMPYSVAKLRQDSWELITNVMAAGVRPENLFIQSMIPEHTELCWIFNCFCSYGQLTRMTQFKDKSKQSTEKSDGFISVGLLDYPVLQTADILIYKADFVPVGKDQDQHLELARDIAQRFNSQVGKDYFVMPETLHSETPKILSTADPSKKMSKSAGEKHFISVFSDEDRIRKQIKSAVTDTGESTGKKMSPGINNLFEIIKGCGNTEAYNALMQDYKSGHLKYVDLKEATANSLMEHLRPIRERKKELQADKRAIKDAVKASSEEIRKVARQTLSEVKELTGLMNAR